MMIFKLPSTFVLVFERENARELNRRCCKINSTDLHELISGELAAGWFACRRIVRLGAVRACRGLVTGPSGAPDAGVQSR